MRGRAATVATARAMIGGALIVLLAACGDRQPPREFWTPAELAAIESMSITRLPPLPPSPGNPVADDPRAVALGHRLFFDPRLSANGAVACASCHRPDYHFKDDVARSRGIGRTARKSMSVVGAAYSPWLFWDGRRDSLWAQALEPLEDPVEHGATRVQVARLLRERPDYRDDYETLFGPLPDLDDTDRFPSANPQGDPEQRAAWAAMAPEDQTAVATVFANVGRALEAYQRRLLPGPAPFDAFADALVAGDQARAKALLTVDQRQGLKLFVGRANCIHCHNGPLLTNHEFHNTGLTDPGAMPTDRGRAVGVDLLRVDPFNCLGRYSPADPQDCAELRFVKTTGIELEGAFRTVSLRNIAGSGPFMHTGQFETLSEVVDHYNRAQPTLISAELTPLRLTAGQIQQLVAFLDSLSAPLATPAYLLEAPLLSQ